MCRIPKPLVTACYSEIRFSREEAHGQGPKMSKSRCCVSAVRNDDTTIRRNFHSPGQVPRCPRSVHTLRCFDAQVKRSEIALPGIFFIHLRCNVQVLTIANRTGPFCVILCLLHSVATSEPENPEGSVLIFFLSLG